MSAKRTTERHPKTQLNSKRRAQLQTLFKLTNAIASSVRMDLHQMLRNILKVATKLTDAQMGSLFLLDEPKGELIPHLAIGPGSRKIKGVKVKLGESITGWVAKTGKPQNIQDVHLDHRFTDPLGRGKYLRAQLSTPLKIKDRVIGVLNVFNKRLQDRFTDDDLLLLGILANQAASCIESAKLREEWHRKAEELSALMAVSSVVVSQLRLDELLTSVMAAATQLTGAQASSLGLIDEETGELLFRVALGEKAEKVKLLRLKLGEGVLGWVAKYGRPALIEDATTDPRHKKELAQQIGFEVKSIICVPVIYQDKVIGAIEALNKSDGLAFNKDDLELLSTFANQAGIAIANARLYENIRETLFGAIESQASALEAKDPYTIGHSRRVTQIALAMADVLDFTAQQKEEIRITALLHDVGKIGIDEYVLRKPDKLTPEERKIIQRHPQISYEILEKIRQLEPLLPSVLHHHEHFNGSGYPKGLKGDDVPPYAAIIAVADVFDAMTSDRPYRKALTKEEALKIIKENAGKQFHPQAVEAFFKAYESGLIT